MVIRVELIPVVEDALEGVGRQVRRVRVHVPQEQEERFVLRGEPLQLGDRHLVQVLGLVASTFFPRAPALEVEVLLEAA